MAETSWAQLANVNFFATRKSPTQLQCDQAARSISGSSAVHPVDTPGSMSYTVVCTGRRGEPDLVVSFREPEAELDGDMVKLAQEIHGCLVPGTTNHGAMSGADPPLTIYAMEYLPGVSWLESMDCEVKMDFDNEARHTCYVKHLGRYFARCWSHPQSANVQLQVELEAGIRRRLASLKELAPPVLPSSTISELEQSLPMIFSQGYPQVVTHRELSVTNVLVNESTLEITGIVDWSLATVLPFGMELDCLLLATGYMLLDGWHHYECRPRLLAAFWEEFWAASGIEEGATRENIRVMAGSAANIAVVLRYAFQRNGDGSPSETVSVSSRMSQYLEAWFNTS